MNIAGLWRMATGVGKGAINAVKAGGIKGTIGIAAFGVSTISGYRNAEKDQKIQGLAKGAAQGIMYAYMPHLWVIEGAAKGLEKTGNWYMSRIHQGPWERISAGRPNFGGGFSDTQQAATMRQRALEAMQNSHINARSILGSEARTYHRSGAYRGRYN